MKHFEKFVFIGISLCLLLVSSCQFLSQQESTSLEQKIANNLEQANELNMSSDRLAIPENISNALLPSMQLPIYEGNLTLEEEHFDITIDNAQARKVFMGLAEGTSYSVVVHPKVDGKISLQMKGVTFPEVMDVLRRMYGYEYEVKDKRYLILGRGMQTRLYPVNYLNFKRVGRSDTSVNAGELTQSGSSGSSESGGGSSANIGVTTESEANFWSELKDTLATLIGEEDGRKVVVNPQAGLVVVRAMPDELYTVEKFLKTTHSAINRQVILEAKVLEVKLSDTFQSGINWAALGRNGITGSQVGGGSLVAGSGVSNIAGNAGNLNPGSPTPVNLMDTSAFGGIFTLALNNNTFQSFIELLETQGDVRVISSPRVATVNNQKAVIKVGGDEFFVTGVTNSSSTSGTTTTQTPTVELTPFFSGVALDVTPQIDSDGNILLHIHPTVSEVVQKNRSFILGGEDFNIPLAVSSIQESDSIVRTRSGQTIVIGGLMKEVSNDDEASVPLLGDIPILGSLFKHKKRVRTKMELVILVKPTIVNSTYDWRMAIKDSKRNFREIRR